MYTLLVSAFMAFITVGLGAALLGWIGKFGPALVSLAISIVGMLGTGLIAKTLDAVGAGMPTWLAVIGLSTILLAGAVVVFARLDKGDKGLALSEVDYAAIGQKRLADLNAVVAANKAARKASS